MKKFWFYLDPYTFVFKGIRGWLVYNSLNGESIDVDNSQTEITRILEEINKKDSGYCTLLTERQVENEIIHRFINNIKKTFCGDIIDCSLSKVKPFVIKPLLDLLNDPRKSELSKDMFNHDNLLSYIHDVSIYINTTCKMFCKYCNAYYKQNQFCTLYTQKQMLCIEDYNELLLRLNTIGIKKIKLFGGDLLSCSLFDELLKLIDYFNIDVEIYIHYRNILPLKLSHIEFNNNLSFFILSDSISIKEENIKKLDRECSLNNIFYSWIFVITSEDELNIINNLINDNKISANLFPFFNGSNLDFFKQYVYLNKGDILDETISKKQIFSRQVLNENFFGKISIMPDGSVYTNLNGTSIGNLKTNSLNEIIYNEISKGDSWLHTRSQGICLDCRFRYLCPSPGSYELVIGNRSLCNVIQK